MILDYIRLTVTRSHKSINWVLDKTGLIPSTYYRWRHKEAEGDLSDRYKPIPNLDAALPEEIEAVIGYALENPKDGYRRLTYMMIDENIACLSPSSVYRILSDRDLLYRFKRSSKSTGKYDYKPDKPHDQWHTDIMYLWVKHRWYFFVGVLDAYSRYIVHWELLETMSASDVRAVVESALKKYPVAKPRIVTDNGSQFKSKEFRQLIKEFSLKDIKIRIHHPESNGSIERFHRSLREEGLSDQQLQDKYQAFDIIKTWVDYYNHQRLHSALNYLSPSDYLRDRKEQRLQERRTKLKHALKKRRQENLRLLSQKDVKEQPNGGSAPKPPRFTAFGGAGVEAPALGDGASTTPYTASLGAQVPSQDCLILLRMDKGNISKRKLSRC